MNSNGGSDCPKWNHFARRRKWKFVRTWMLTAKASFSAHSDSTGDVTARNSKRVSFPRDLVTKVDANGVVEQDPVSILTDDCPLNSAKSLSGGDNSDCLSEFSVQTDENELLTYESVALSSPDWFDHTLLTVSCKQMSPQNDKMRKLFFRRWKLECSSMEIAIDDLNTNDIQHATLKAQLYREHCPQLKSLLRGYFNHMVADGDLQFVRNISFISNCMIDLLYCGERCCGRDTLLTLSQDTSSPNQAKAVDLLRKLDVATNFLFNEVRENIFNLQNALFLFASPNGINQRLRDHFLNRLDGMASVCMKRRSFRRALLSNGADDVVSCWQRRYQDLVSNMAAQERVSPRPNEELVSSSEHSESGFADSEFLTKQVQEIMELSPLEARERGIAYFLLYIESNFDVVEKLLRWSSAIGMENLFAVLRVDSSLE
jgi:hypothetical protein